jgi:hypothetical protein
MQDLPHLQHPLFFYKVIFLGTIGVICHLKDNICHLQDNICHSSICKLIGSVFEQVFEYFF